MEDGLLKWKLRRGSIEAMARVYEKYLNSMPTLATGLLTGRLWVAVELTAGQTKSILLDGQ